jgi:hypothetical protein
VFSNVHLFIVGPYRGDFTFDEVDAAFDHGVTIASVLTDLPSAIKNPQFGQAHEEECLPVNHGHLVI